MYLNELSEISAGNHDNLALVDNKSFVMKKLGLPARIRIMSGAVIEFLPQINVNYATLVRAHTGGLIGALSQATPGTRNQIQRNMLEKIIEIRKNSSIKYSKFSQLNTADIYRCLQAQTNISKWEHFHKLCVECQDPRNKEQSRF